MSTGATVPRRPGRTADNPASIPPWIEDVFRNCLTCVVTTVSDGGPVSYPLLPDYIPETRKIILSSAPAFSKKVESVRKHPKISLLFSNSTGSEPRKGPVVLVQGTATIDDKDFYANARFIERFVPNLFRKQPSSMRLFAPGIGGWFTRKLMGWYLYRIFIEVTPERILAWEDGDQNIEPEILEA